MDSMVGKVLETLDACGIADDTLVIFAGDNGTEGEARINEVDHQLISDYQGRPVQGGKRTLKDTGSRVPFLVRWTGVIKAGTTYNGLMDFSDIFSTLVEVGGGTIPSDRIIDGQSFYSQLRGEQGESRQFIYSSWDRSDNLDNPHHFIRDARYKWVIRDEGKMPVGLYDCIGSPFEEVLIEKGKETKDQAKARARLKAHYESLFPN